MIVLFELRKELTIVNRQRKDDLIDSNIMIDRDIQNLRQGVQTSVQIRVQMEVKLARRPS